MPDLNEVKISLSPEAKDAVSPVAQTAAAINHASLGANATPPSALSNLFHSNVVASTNLSAQNASSLQNALAKINLSALGKAIDNVQGAQASPTRSLVDVLTSDELAAMLASLKAVQSGRRDSSSAMDPLLFALYRSLRRLYEKFRAEVRAVEAINGRITGHGTESSPYKATDGGPLFAKTPITLGFDVPPSQVSIEQLKSLLGL